MLNVVDLGEMSLNVDIGEMPLNAIDLGEMSLSKSLILSGAELGGNVAGCTK